MKHMYIFFHKGQAVGFSDIPKRARMVWWSLLIHNHMITKVVKMRKDHAQDYINQVIIRAYAGNDSYYD